MESKEHVGARRRNQKISFLYIAGTFVVYFFDLFWTYLNLINFLSKKDFFFCFCLRRKRKSETFITVQWAITKVVWFKLIWNLYVLASSSCFYSQNYKAAFTEIIHFRFCWFNFCGLCGIRRMFALPPPSALVCLAVVLNFTVFLLSSVQLSLLEILI